MSKSPSGGQAAGSVPLPGSKRGFRGFFSEVGRELKKVNWPARKEVSRLTGVVLAICTIALLYLFLLQNGFHQVILLITEGF